ncbi:MAG: hypothetical protein ACREJO_06740 [Phycisphaerales bacterium]
MTVNTENTPIIADRPMSATTQLARSAGGIPVRMRRGRRGSVIVLVVGVLALLAIVVLVYTSLGQTDRRASAALVNKVRTDDVTRTAGEYIAQKIGEGAVNTYYQQPGFNTANVPYATTLIRQSWTYPSTDYELVSSRDSLVPGGGGGNALSPREYELRRFNASGNIAGLWTVNDNPNRALADPRRASDPYLAAIEPSWRNAFAVWGNSTSGAAENPGTGANGFSKMYRYYRDWNHITNVAPDGRYVNLAWLRGNFNVPSGIGAGMTTYGLTLLPAQSMAQIDSNTPPLTRGSSQAQIMANGGAADLNRPAHWSTNQLGMARLAKDTRYALGDPRHMLNQWCDTDGDGILDSRWQELVDASVLDFATPLIPTNLLPSASGARYFIAARVVDLSGMAPVNVGMDMELPALANDLASNVIGLTPADFNLESVLSFDHAYAYWGFGPETFGQPMAVNAAGNTSKYDRSAGSGPMTNAKGAGQAAFSSILDAKLKGAPAGRGETFVVNEIDTNYRGLQPSSDAAGTNAAANFIFPQGTGPMNSESRELMYRLAAKDPFGATVRRTPGTGNNLFYGLSNPFGMPDEKELRTFWTSSDPGSISRLEAAIDGRFAAPGDPSSTRFGPLMSNRGLDASRDVRTALPGALQNPQPAIMGAEQAAGWLDQGIATRQLLTDVRHQLTTYSGSRPLKQFDLTGAPNSNLNIGEVRTDITTLIDTALSDTAQPLDRVTAIDSLVGVGMRTLAPFSNLKDSWLPTNLRSRSLAYGGVRTLVDSGGAEKDWEGCAPELAIRAGAHWAVNLLSMRDSGDKPIAFTVRLDGSSAGLTAINSAVDPQNQQQFFFGMNTLTSTVNNTLKLWGPTSAAVDTTTNQPERSAIPVAYLSNTTTNQAGRGPNESKAINVFSITPQPFITQVSSFVMYGDRRVDAGGDGQGVEWVLDPADPMGARPDRVTIDPKVDISNGDFVIEIVAFQVTNPFNKIINLSSSTVANGAALPDADFRYYLEFAGRNYKLAEFDPTNGNNARAIELQPGQTRTFYIIPQNPAFYAPRFSGIDGNIASPAEAAQLIQSFVNAQLASGTGPSATNPVRIVAFDAQNGTPAVANSDVGVLYPQSATALPNPPADINHVARLWRTIRVDNETAINSVYNDQLVDRIRDPLPTSQQASLNRRLPPGAGTNGTIIVAGSRAGPDPVEVTAYPGVSLGTVDNTGFSICFAGSFRRPDNPGTIEMGVLPAYCIEAKSSLAELPSTDPYARRQRQGGASLNISESAVPVTGLARADFGGTVNATTFSIGNTTLKALLQTSPLIIPSTNVNPDVRTTAPIRDADGGYHRDGQTPNRTFLERPIQLYVTPIPSTTNANEKAPPMRPADMLLALGVGPYQDPLAQLSGTTDRFDKRNIDVQWTTLSEALALVLDYDSAASEKHVEWNIGGPDTAADPAGGLARRVCSAFDRGHLRIDAFTLFNDVNGNGKFDQSNAPDPVIGRGIPAALGLLDEFRTTPWGSATSSVFGAVNGNTATRAVLASLSPLWAPIAGTWATDTAISIDPIWDVATNPNETYDPVSTFLAYRDKTLNYSRASSNNSFRIPADFRDGNDPNLGTNVDHANIYTASGRRKATQLIAIREQPGFQSIGEIMAATMADDAEFFPNLGPGSQQPDSAQRAQNSIDRFERVYRKFDPKIRAGVAPYNLATDSPVGISSMLYLPIGAAAGTPRNPSPAKGLYEHKLAVANSVLNTLSTRSDVFCVYFVLNGYLPSDVEGLAAYDTDQQGYMNAGFVDNAANTPVVAPMVPSIQRRFMMIVDRSNVVAAGDKPRILMFEELPMK